MATFINKRPLVRLLFMAIAILTFFVGLATVAVWLSWHRYGDLASTSLPCFPQFNSEPSFSGSADGFYFPPLTFSPIAELNDVRVKLPSQVLQTMKEPSYLSFPGCDGKSYRFLFIHTNHPPIAVRAWRCGNEQFLFTNELDGEGGNNFGTHSVSRTRLLTKQEWMSIEDLLDNASYWTLPTYDATLSTSESLHSIGSLWIIEGFSNGRYHVVSRWSPSDSKYRSIGLYLLDLGRVEIDKTYLN